MFKYKMKKIICIIILSVIIVSQFFPLYIKAGDIIDFPDNLTWSVDGSTARALEAVQSAEAQTQLEVVRTETYESALEQSGIKPQFYGSGTAYDGVSMTMALSGILQKTILKNDQDYSLRIQAIQGYYSDVERVFGLDVPEVAFATVDYADMVISSYINMATGEIKPALVTLKDQFYHNVKTFADQFKANNGVSVPALDINGNPTQLKVYSNRESFSMTYHRIDTSDPPNIQFYRSYNYLVKVFSATAPVLGFSTPVGGFFYISKERFSMQYKYSDDYVTNNNWSTGIPNSYKGWYYVQFANGICSPDSGREFLDCGAPYPEVGFNYARPYIDTLPAPELITYPPEVSHVSYVPIEVPDAPKFYPKNLPEEIPEVKPNFFPEDIESYVNNIDTAVEEATDPGPDPDADPDPNPAVLPIDVPFIFPQEVPVPHYDPEVNPEIFPHYDPDTDPWYQPDPNPNPDPGTDPDPNPNPNPNPDPNPDPDPDPEPGENEETDLEIPSTVGTLSLMDRFPFCVPKDLVNAFKLFVAEPETPVWTWHLKVNGTNVESDYTVDLHKFDRIAELCRLLLTLSFIVALVKITRNIIKG